MAYQNLSKYGLEVGGRSRFVTNFLNP